MTAVADRSDRGATTEPTARAGAAGPRWYLLLPAFAIVSIALTFPSLGKLNSHVVGNSGDSLFVMWILGWVQHAIPHGWDTLWNTSMYSPTTNTLAYSESMLSVALAQWPLRIFFGPELSLNLIAIGAQTAALWFMYRLALVLTRSWPSAVVAGLMFGFSMPLLSHFGHYQLVLSAFLVPLCLLLLVHYFETFQLRYGIGVGLTLAALATSATYYALMAAVGIAVIVLGYLVWFRPRRLWIALRGLVVGGAIALVIVLPVAVQYMDLQDDPHFRRGFEPDASAHLSDFLSPDGASYVLDHLPVLRDNTVDHGIESHLYPGLFTFGFGVVGAVVVVRGLRRRRDDADPRVESGPGEPPAVPAALDDPRSPGTSAQWISRLTVLICAAGAAAVVLAFGDQVQVFGQTVWMPMKVFRKIVPGFSGIRAMSRLVLLGQCALALLAAFGVRALLARLGTRLVAVVVAVLCALVLVESARVVPYVEPPDDRTSEAVGRFLDARPDGVVAELPIRGIPDGFVWAYTESPRQYLSLVDKNRRVNGYSGFSPPGFDETVPDINTFPSRESLALLDERDVRYVVLRTKVVGEQFPDVAALLRQDGVGRFTPATARERIAEIPPERVRKVSRVPGAYIVELRPARNAR